MGTQIRDIVEVNITRESARVTQAGFGTPMIFGEHARFSDRSRAYNDPADMLTDGFLATDNHYLAAVALMSQARSPQQFKVGRKLGNFNAIQQVDFTGIASAGTFTLTLGAETTAGIAWDAALSAIESAIEALTAVTSVSASGSIASGTLVIEFLTPGFQAVSTMTVDVSSLTGVTAGSVSIVQVGSAVETWTVGLAALRNEGAGGDDDWYGLGILSRTSQDIQDIAAAIEATTNPKMFFAASQDADIIGSGSADLFSILQALNYDLTNYIYLSTAGQNEQQKVVADINPTAGTYTITLDGVTSAPIQWNDNAAAIKTALEAMTNIGFVEVTGVMDTSGFTIEWSGVDGLKPISAITVDISSLTTTTAVTITEEQAGNMSFPEFAWMGGQLPKDPGSITWKFKQLVGVTPDVLTTTAVNNIEGKNGNTYQTVGGVSITQQGVVASGEFIDIIRGVAWIESRLGEEIFTVLVNADKIPYTDPGVGVIVGTTRAFLTGPAVDNSVLTENTISVSAPLVADISDANKASRLLPDVEFSGTLAGAVHKVILNGKVSV
jgi:hypothetical protein